MIDFYYICYSEPTEKLFGEFNQPKEAHQMLQSVIVSESEQAKMANPENLNIIGTIIHISLPHNLSCEVKSLPNLLLAKFDSDALRARLKLFFYSEHSVSPNTDKHVVLQLYDPEPPCVSKLNS